jgi:hypothetical protein
LRYCLELTPVERDTYMLRMMIVRFRRDARGKVTGFEYSNPVVKGSHSRGSVIARAPRPRRRE